LPRLCQAHKLGAPEPKLPALAANDDALHLGFAATLIHLEKQSVTVKVLSGLSGITHRLCSEGFCGPSC
jgi:hypothetical protein